MYSLTICFGPTGTIWTLLFKEESKAADIYNDWTGGQMANMTVAGALIAADDFGQALTLDRHSIHGMMLEEMDASQLGAVERGLHQARSQAKAQTRAMEDPVIKESIRRQQMGPAVMSPIPGGRFNG